jgi:uncharacterized protein (DUF2461 family)
MLCSWSTFSASRFSSSEGTITGGTGSRQSNCPKFHCELNFIERFWCQAKWYARENCKFNFLELRKLVLETPDSIYSAMIHKWYLRCIRGLESYENDEKYGTKGFKDRQVVDKTK